MNSCLAGWISQILDELDFGVLCTRFNIVAVDILVQIFVQF